MKKFLLITVFVLLTPICNMGMEPGCGDDQTRTAEMSSSADQLIEDGKLSEAFERMIKDYNLVAGKLIKTMRHLDSADRNLTIAASNTSEADFLNMQQEMMRQQFLLVTLSNIAKSKTEASKATAKK